MYLLRFLWLVFVPFFATAAPPAADTAGSCAVFTVSSDSGDLVPLRSGAFPDTSGTRLELLRWRWRAGDAEGRALLRLNASQPLYAACTLPAQCGAIPVVPVALLVLQAPPPSETANGSLSVLVACPEHSGDVVLEQRLWQPRVFSTPADTAPAPAPSPHTLLRVRDAVRGGVRVHLAGPGVVAAGEPHRWAPEALVAVAADGRRPDFLRVAPAADDNWTRLWATHLPHRRGVAAAPGLTLAALFYFPRLAVGAATLGAGAGAKGSVLQLYHLSPAVGAVLLLEASGADSLGPAAEAAARLWCGSEDSRLLFSRVWEGAAPDASDEEVDAVTLLAEAEVWAPGAAAACGSLRLRTRVTCSDAAHCRVSPLQPVSPFVPATLSGGPDSPSASCRSRLPSPRQLLSCPPGGGSSSPSSCDVAAGVLRAATLAAIVTLALLLVRTAQDFELFYCLVG